MPAYRNSGRKAEERGKERGMEGRKGEKNKYIRNEEKISGRKEGRKVEFTEFY